MLVASYCTSASTPNIGKKVKEENSSTVTPSPPMPMPSAPPSPPAVHTLVGLDYSALTTPVYKTASVRRNRSYDVRHVDLREKRATQQYTKL